MLPKKVGQLNQQTFFLFLQKKFLKILILYGITQNVESLMQKPEA
jgi:hypothetical protein